MSKVVNIKTREKVIESTLNSPIEKFGEQLSVGLMFEAARKADGFLLQTVELRADKESFSHVRHLACFDICPEGNTDCRYLVYLLEDNNIYNLIMSVSYNGNDENLEKFSEVQENYIQLLCEGLFNDGDIISAKVFDVAEG